jgi:5-methylcytosine-specific restriction endonuclease McrA
MPRSRGGQNTWKNMVTCCSRCNLYKGDKTPEEVGMKLKSQPYEPTIFSNVVSDEIEHIWNDFKRSFV